MQDEYHANRARPVLDSEPRYEDHPIFINFKFEHEGFWRAHHVRGALYQALFAGAAGHAFGHFSVWDFYDPERSQGSAGGYIDEAFGDLMRQRPPWQQALDAPGAAQMQHAKALVLSRPYFSRIPDQSLLAGEQGEGERHIGAVRDGQGNDWILVVDDASKNFVAPGGAPLMGRVKSCLTPSQPRFTSDQLRA